MGNVRTGLVDEAVSQETQATATRNPTSALFDRRGIGALLGPRKERESRTPPKEKTEKHDG
jgi:hypothetical protein